MIFYFSGSGNSLYTARKIAGQEGGGLISIADAIKAGKYRYEPEKGEAVGFVIPTYFFGVPTIVREFLAGLLLGNASENYIYLVLTCGGTTANAGGMFAALLAERGCRLSASFSVVMVDNYVPLFTMPTDEKRDAILRKADARIEEICRMIVQRTAGDHDSCKGLAPLLVTAVSYPLYHYGRKTGKFAAGASCSGCGLCAEICPSAAIVMEEGRPSWVKDKCTLCFGCLHRCPRETINYGKKTAAHGRYVHPGAALEE